MESLLPTIVNSKTENIFPTILIFLINKLNHPLVRAQGAYQRLNQQEASVQGADERGFVVSGIKSAGFS